MPKDYYKLLGVQKNASPDEIKKAFRRLAHQYHPDKPKGDEKKFKEINEAYQILSDEKKRRNYDRFGTAEPFPGGGGGHGGGNPFSGGAHGFGFEDMGDLGDLGDIFETMFEDLGIHTKRRTYRRGSDLEYPIEISLEESFRGAVKNLEYETAIRCAECQGQGADVAAGFKKCERCDGKGEVREEKRSFFGNFSQIKPCEGCYGRGKIPNKVCEACKGSGRVKGKRQVQISILPGVQNGQILTVKGAGESGEHSTGEGDLYVRILIAPHPTFERHNDDLRIRKEISIFDLLLQRKIEVPILGGGVKSIDLPAHFNIQEEIRVSHEGMPHLGSFGRGDLLVRLILKAPKKLSAKAKKLIEDAETEE
ncbi:MAG: J domain-containing protein [Patescibacteria group bacterium]